MSDTLRRSADNSISPPERSDSTGLAGRSVYQEIDDTLGYLRNALHVDALTVLVVSEAEQAFYPVASSGFDTQLMRDYREPAEELVPDLPYTDVPPATFHDADDASIHSPLQRLPDIAGIAIVPLAHEGRLRGFLHLGTRQHQGIHDGNSDMLGLAGHAVTLALDRAELRRAEERARAISETTRERLTFLAIASGLFSSSLDYETTLSQITGMLVPRVADVCAVVLLDENGNANEVTTDGIDPNTTRLVHLLQSRYTLSPGSQSIVRRVLNTGKTEFHPSLTEEYFEQTAENAEHLQLLKQLDMRSMVIVPLTGRGETIGALSVAYVGDGRRYTLEDVDFIEELAHRAALAVENARLFQSSQYALEQREESLRFREESLKSERVARARAEAAQRREAFLSEASNVVSASLDSKSTLENLARLVVERAADWFTIELFDNTGQSSLAVAAHRSPDQADLLQRIRREYVPSAIPDLPPRHVLRYREPMLINNVSDEFWFDSTSTPENLTLFEQLESGALIVVPLFVRDQTLGVMLLANTRASGPFDEDDLSMAIDLGYRVSLALDNSRLYHSTQDILKQQEEFISTASHELKTPLTTVKGYLQLINRQLHREDHSPERIVRFTRELEQQVRRLEDLVSDLLDVSRIQQGQLDLRLEQFDLVELASNVLSRFEHAPERLEQHRLRLEAADTIEGTWDRGRLDQVLTNLVSNALKYSPDGGDVLIRLRRSGDFARISVRDSGIGIGPEERSTLFQPFVRGKNTKPQISGTGLGLYITQRIVQNHHGRIFVRSEPGRGTTFTIQLPLRSDVDS